MAMWGKVSGKGSEVEKETRAHWYWEFWLLTIWSSLPVAEKAEQASSLR